MCFTVTSDKSCPVYRDHNRKILQTDIMKRLVIRSLQKRRIYCKYRFHSPRRKTCRKCHRMFFRDPHIKKTIWEMLCKRSKTCSVRHRSRNRNDTLVFFCNIKQHFRKYFRISIRPFWFFRISGLKMERTCPMKFCRIFLCRKIPFSFFRKYMY